MPGNTLEVTKAESGYISATSKVDNTQRGVDLVFHDLVVKYGPNPALKGIDGFVPAGKLVAVMGATGAGKTTLLKTLADQLPVDQGRILYDGKELKQCQNEDMKGKIGIVDQDDVFLPMLPVRETLIAAAHFRNPDKKDCERQVDMILKKLKIDEQGKQTLGTISGGQRKRFCIARELVTNPELILADEPTSGLDSSLAKVLVDLLKEISVEQNTSVFCSIQQPSEGMFVQFDMIMFLHAGECVYFGPPSGVLAHINYFGKGIQMAIDDGVPNFMMDVIANGILQEAGGMELAVTAVKKETQKAISYYIENEDVKKAQQKRHQLRVHKRTFGERWSSWWRHFGIVTYRLIYIDFWEVFALNNVLVWIGVQLIAVWIFFRPNDGITGLQSRAISPLFLMGIPFWITTFGLFPRYYIYANVLIKDLQVGNHSLSAWWAARLIGTLWLDLVMPAITLLIFYGIAWPNPDGIVFFYSWASAVAMVVVFAWFGYWVSQIFSFHNAHLFMALWVSFSFFYTEFFAPGDTIIDGLRWLKWVGYYNYSYVIQLYTIWDDSLIIPCVNQQEFIALSPTDQANNVLCPNDAFCNDPPNLNLSCNDPGCTSATADLLGCTTNGPQLIEQGRYVAVQGTLWLSWTVYTAGFCAGIFFVGFAWFVWNHNRYVGGANRNRDAQANIFLKEAVIAGKKLHLLQDDEANTKELKPLMEDQDSSSATTKPDLTTFTSIPLKDRATAFDFTVHRIDNVEDEDGNMQSDSTLIAPSAPTSPAGRASSTLFSKKTIILKSGDSLKLNSSMTKGMVRKDSLASSASVGGMNIVVENLDVKYGESIHALNNVSFSVKEGSLVALMGASGSGKTTTIHAILNKIPEFVAGGKVTYNGHEWQTCMRQYVGFVEQDDIIIPALTLRQSLMYTARFRIVDVSTHVVKVNQLLVDLQLEKCADMPLGVVSAGQRKRFCIARELLGDPKLLVLDEPTSSLDSTMSRQLMESLRNLVNNYGMTIVSSIHQPSQSIFRSFDKVLLLDKGRQFYYGPPAKVLSSFGTFGLRRPQTEVPMSAAEFMLDALVHDYVGDQRDAITEACQAKAEKENKGLSKVHLQHASDDPEMLFHDRETPHWWPQCVALSSRLWRLERPDYYSVSAGFMFLGLILVPGLVALDINGRLENDYDIRRTVVNLTLFTWVIVPFSNGVIRIFQCEAYLRKELSTNSYSLKTYWFARLIISYWYEMIWPLVWTCIVYWMWNPNPSAGTFFAWFGLVPTLVACVWRCTSMMLSFAIKPNQIALTLSFLLTFNFVWNPYFLEDGRLPDAAAWIRYVSLVTFQYDMLVATVFNSKISFVCEAPDVNSTTLPLKACDGINYGDSVPGNALIEDGDLSVDVSFWACFGILCGVLVVVLVVSYGTLRFRLRALFRNIKSGKLAQ